jgi:hypothetical protein
VYGEWLPHALAPVVPIVLAPWGAVRTGDDQARAAPAAQAVRAEVGGERLEEVDAAVAPEGCRATVETRAPGPPRTDRTLKPVARATSVGHYRLPCPALNRRRAP